MPYSVNGYGGFGFATALIGFGVLGAAIGTPYWLTPPVSQATQGLFQSCTGSSCSNMDWTTQIPSGITNIVTLAILLFAGFLWLIGIICAIVALAGGPCIRVAGGFHVTSGLFVWIACGVFTAMEILYVGYTTPFFSASYFGYSYYLCWSSGAVIIVAGGFEAAGYNCPTIQVHLQQNHELAWIDPNQKLPQEDRLYPPLETQQPTAVPYQKHYNETNLSVTPGQL